MLCPDQVGQCRDWHFYALEEWQNGLGRGLTWHVRHCERNSSIFCVQWKWRGCWIWCYTAGIVCFILSSVVTWPNVHFLAHFEDMSSSDYYKK